MFVTRAFWLFRPVQKKRVSVSVMRNLHLMLMAESAHLKDKEINHEFWTTICNFVGDASIDVQWAVDCLDGFLAGHVDTKSWVADVLKSQVGAYVVASVLQRILGNKNNNLYTDTALPKVDESMGKICKCATLVLQDVFQGTASSDTVWQVVAILDALAPPGDQLELRATLKQLLDNGHAPPPPTE